MSKRETKTFHIKHKNSWHELTAKIWTHINANTSRKCYYTYQDWWWPGSQNDSAKRKFSFLGFFRKYSEADLMEMIRLYQIVRAKKTILKLEHRALFCDFHGMSIFDVLYKCHDFLEKVIIWLKTFDD